MARVFIGALMGSPEGPRRYSENAVTELPQKILTFMLACEEGELDAIAKKYGITPVEKPMEGKNTIYYRAEDFPNIIRGVQELEDNGRDRDFIKAVVVNDNSFEIVYPSGSKMRFLRE